jgi:SAM-dependent methyltransferase
MLSEPQWADLLGGRPRGKSGTAIDVGAGDGSLTAAFRPLFSSVVATEVTLPLVHRLKALKLDARLAEALDPKALGRDAFDVAFIMNVLDRCKDPHALLRDTRALLPDDGWLVVSVVMPPTQSDAMARVGAKQRRWAVAGADFEAAAASLVRELLLPSGFEPLRLVRVPYLCAGDRHSPVAALDAAVLVLRKAEPREPRPLDGGGAGGDDHSHGPN